MVSIFTSVFFSGPSNVTLREFFSRELHAVKHTMMPIPAKIEMHFRFMTMLLRKSLSSLPRTTSGKHHRVNTMYVADEK